MIWPHRQGETLDQWCLRSVIRPPKQQTIPGRTFTGRKDARDSVRILTDVHNEH